LDDGVRFTLRRPVVGRNGTEQFFRRMSKQDFIKQIQELESSEHAKIPFHGESLQNQPKQLDRRTRGADSPVSPGPIARWPESPHSRRVKDDEGSLKENNDIPTHDGAASLPQYSGHEKSAAKGPRRRPATSLDYPPQPLGDSDDDGSERIPPSHWRQAGFPSTAHVSSHDKDLYLNTSETPAERKRRLAALGELNDNEIGTSTARGSKPQDSDSEDDGQPRAVRGRIQFADGTRPAKAARERSDEGDGNGNERDRSHRPRISWGGERGRHA